MIVADAQASDRGHAPATRQLVVVVSGIVVLASIAGIVAMRVRHEQDMVANRHRIEAEFRDADVVDALRSAMDDIVQVAPPPPEQSAPTLISAALRPGLPVSLDVLLPDSAGGAIAQRRRIGDYDIYVVDTDRFAERAKDGYGEWLSSTELIPIDPFAWTRLPEIPRLHHGDVLVAVQASNAGAVRQVIVLGRDPIFSNAAVFESDE